MEKIISEMNDGYGIAENDLSQNSKLFPLFFFNKE